MEDNLEEKVTKDNVESKRGKSKAYVQVKKGHRKGSIEEKDLDPSIEITMLNKGKEVVVDDTPLQPRINEACTSKRGVVKKNRFEALIHEEDVRIDN